MINLFLRKKTSKHESRIARPSDNGDDDIVGVSTTDKI